MYKSWVETIMQAASARTAKLIGRNCWRIFIDLWSQDRLQHSNQATLKLYVSFEISSQGFRMSTINIKASLLNDWRVPALVFCIKISHSQQRAVYKNSIASLLSCWSAAIVRSERREGRLKKCDRDQERARMIFSLRTTLELWEICSRYIDNDHAGNGGRLQYIYIWSSSRLCFFLLFVALDIIALK